ncbi:MAG: Gfo/Idh/MocA family oxidoreductase [Gemmobacter sp.]|uniref:Gfo/Idh/MocA family oxidoreductase n=1 Tax=Gemmobacter sp. TaxID=1898957 RepID=UPI00391A1881
MSGVAIVGGGRWARVLGSVLARIDPGPVSVCSPGNPAAWADRPQGWRMAGLDAIWRDAGIAHVLIARRARDHAETVLAALAAGKAVLVEKPFCLTRAEADAILAAGGTCRTGLVFLHAGYLARFRAAVLAAGRPQHLVLTWSDPTSEHRHGAAKTHDASLNVVQDVLPHAWSVLRPLLPADPALTAAAIADGGARVDLTWQAGDATAEIRLCRGAAQRVRHLALSGAGLEAALDFAAEPGAAMLNGAPLDVAAGHASPLEAELRGFLAGAMHPLADVAQAVQALDLTLAAMARIRPLQAQAIRAGHAGALREVALGGIAGDGRPAARADIARWLGLAEDAPAFNAAWTAAFPPDMSGGKGR